MEPDTLPPDLARLDESSPRFAKIRRMMAPKENLYSIYEYRRRKAVYPVIIMALFLGTAHMVFHEVRIDGTSGIAIGAGFFLMALVYWILACRNVIWYAFSRDKLYVRTAYRAGIFHEQIAVEKGNIRKVEFLADRPHSSQAFRVEATLLDGKTVVLQEPNDDFDRTKWFADAVQQWLGRY